jgi:hypothetical protein
MVRRSSEQFSETEVQAYLLDSHQRGAGPAPFQSSKSSVRFLYGHALGGGLSCSRKTAGVKRGN